MLFFTGNSNEGDFRVVQKTIYDRMNISEKRYYDSRKKLQEMGWIQYVEAENVIYVNYDKIYADYRNYQKKKKAGSLYEKAYFMGCDYAAPNTDIYTKLFFTRKVGEDEECAFVSSYEDLVDLKGTLWIYYNTSGGRSGHGLEQVKVELY